MIGHRFYRWLHSAPLGAAAAVLFASVPSAQAAPWAGDRNNFASPRFEQVWRAADLAVQQGRTGRSWTWGPQPWFDYKEIYKQAPNGMRLVQYYDKARMEINDPANTSGALGGVTNGLLVVEMVGGRLKLGNGIGPDENQQKDAANIPVAGDLGNIGEAVNPETPTYASFRDIATVDNGYRDPSKLGQRVGTTLSATRERGFRQDLASLPGTDVVAYEPVTGHNVPRVFEEFRNAGPVPAIAAFGFPITDAYWIRARVGGQDKDVMVQLFERRSLTYTPANPAAFRVEMGNAGQHYFAWRYQNLGAPWASSDPQWPIIFASKQPGPGFMTYQLSPSDQSQTALADGLLPYSVLRSWMPLGHPINHLIYGEVTNAGGKRQVSGFQFFTRHPFRPVDEKGNNYDPVHSPDGQQLVFVSDRDGNPELYLLIPTVYGGEPYINSGHLVQLTDTNGCNNQHPSWLPDGSGIVYESNCLAGNYEIYRLNLSYTVTGQAFVSVTASVKPYEPQRLTDNNANDNWPRVSPDGSQVAFFSNRDGNTEIYTMRIDGGLQTRLTSNGSRDEGPAWSPDGKQIVFNSDRDGDHELYLIKADGSGLRQLTSNSVDDGFAVWAP